MPPTIRRFRKTERQHWDSLWLAYYGESTSPTPTLRQQNKLWRDIHEKIMPLDVYGIWYRKQAVGFVVLVHQYSPHAAKKTLYISDLYVCEKFRRKKLGTRLLEYVFKRYDSSHSRIEWKASPDNIVAIRIYKKYAKKMDWLTFERK